MLNSFVVKQLEAVREQFNASTAGLHEGIAEFRPTDDAMTAAQHIAHAAQVIDWLLEGAFSPGGFDLDFDSHIERTMAVRSLAVARELFEGSITGAILAFRDLDDSEILTLLPDGPVLSGLPRLAIPVAIAEHTSHHRGALAVYARLNNVTPKSPYGI